MTLDVSFVDLTDSSSQENWYANIVAPDEQHYFLTGERIEKQTFICAHDVITLKPEQSLLQGLAMVKGLNLPEEISWTLNEDSNSIDLLSAVNTDSDLEETIAILLAYSSMLRRHQDILFEEES